MGRAARSRPSLGGRLRLLALVIVMLSMVAVIASMSALRSWERTLDRAEEARRAVDDVTDLDAAFRREATAVSGYQLDGDPTAADTILAARAIQRRSIERLEQRDLGLDGLDMHIAPTVAAIDTWHARVADPVLLDEEVPTDETRRHMTAVEDELTQLESMVAAHSRDFDHRVADARRNLFALLFVCAGAAVIGTPAAAVMLRRWILSPLDEISSAAFALARDDSHPLPQFEASELQAVSDAVGSLQASLRAARDDAVAALDSIEQSAVLAIQVRSELADEIGEIPGGWTAHTRLMPAEGVVAGDCFDIGLLDGRTVYGVLIDVTGHGASSALDALTAKSQLRAALRSRLSPGSAIDWLSRERLNDDRSNVLTALVVVIDLETGRISHANAGHPPAIITDGFHVRTIEQSGPLIGAFAASWPTGDTMLETGWTLLLHTDGVTDTVGAGRERFGVERLSSCLTATDPKQLLGGIEAALDEFRVGDRADDAAMIAIHRGPDRSATSDRVRPSLDATVRP